MLDLLRGAYQFIAKIWDFMLNFWDNVSVVLSDWVIDMWGELMVFAWSIQDSLVIPDALSSFQFPDPGPLGATLNILYVPQALAILVAAFTIRWTIKILTLGVF